jgi:hypothetical protein
VAWRHGLTETFTLRILLTTTTTTTGGTITTTTVATTTIQYYAMYRPYDDMEEVRHVFRNSDIVVFDFGLHYMTLPNDMVKFQTVMQRMVDLSAQYQRIRPHLLVWRETSAQHFDRPGGHYGPGGNVHNNNTVNHHQCVPIATEHVPGIRLPIVQGIIAHVQTSWEWNDTESLLFIPYREFTSGLVHLHDPEQVQDGDCTHFCHTPFVWRPIWYHLAIGLQKFEQLFMVQQLQQQQLSQSA